MQVRHEINRGVLALSHPDSLDSNHQSTLLASIALALGADEAFQTGAHVEGQKLIQSASKLMDFTLGFVPALSSANDLVQMTYGMVTGYDYTGKRMLSSDYALRGMSAVLGMIPFAAQVAHASENILRLGGQVITDAFITGADLIRGSGFAPRMAIALRNAPEAAVPLADGLGQILKEVPVAEIATDLEKATRELETLAKGANGDTIRYFAQVLGDAEVELPNRLQLIKSFVPETIRFEILEEFKTVFRWHQGDKGAEQLGRFVSETRFSNAQEARQLLAIPSQNKMLYLDKLEIFPKAFIFRGKVAPNFGKLGGGEQIFIMGTLEEKIKFIDRLNQL